MSTSIARQQKDGPGGGYSTMSNLQGETNAQDRHLLQAASQNRHLLQQFARLRHMADRIKIPRSICDRAQEIYKKLYMSMKLSGDPNFDTKQGRFVQMPMRSLDPSLRRK